MFFYSTNKQTPKVHFEEALLQGLAPDNGLYFPESFPRFSVNELKNLSGRSLQEIGYSVLHKWIGDTIPAQDLTAIVNKALDFPIPLQKVGPYYVLELFHGPTMAFKDVAAKTLGQLTQYFLKKQKRKATILVATSGDTGGAVAQGFTKINNVNVVILFPKGKVSKLQEEQLTRVAENVFPIEVNGVFDDCQAFVKKAFNDNDLKEFNLTSANSINIGRLLPQIIYYVYVYTQLQNENIEFIIPSGNLGNCTAALFARQMRLPFSSFIIATNENDPVVKYHQTGNYNPQQTISTLSNAMDIGSPNNFIRILELFNYDYEKFKDVILATKVADSETIETIKKIHHTHNYLLDPHTAVAWTAAEKKSSKDKTQVIISTASPKKFASEIEKVTGIHVDDSKEIKELQKREKRKYEVENRYDKVKELFTSIIK